MSFAIPSPGSGTTVPEALIPPMKVNAFLPETTRANRGDLLSQLSTFAVRTAVQKAENFLLEVQKDREEFISQLTAAENPVE